MTLLCQSAESATLATDKRTTDALKWAVGKWEHAIKHRIEPPAIYQGVPLDDCGDEDDLACCSRDLNVVIVVRTMRKKMLRSVLLHEIGHLIGLPDIEGDPLMSPYQSEHVALKPTLIDVFCARLVNGWL